MKCAAVVCALKLFCGARSLYTNGYCTAVQCRHSIANPHQHDLYCLHTAVGANLLDLVESGGRGGTREALAVSRTGALRHWRDITAPYRKLDLQLPLVLA
jgi:hypothetical protein